MFFSSIALFRTRNICEQAPCPLAGTTSADSGFICSWMYRGTDSCSDRPSASTAFAFVTVTLMITSPRVAPARSWNTTVMPWLLNAVTVISSVSVVV